MTRCRKTRPYFDEDRAFTALSDTLGDTLLDSRQTLASVDDPYYHTDHHWTTMGAQAVYEQWAAATGHTARSYDLTLASDHFRGTLYSKVLLPDSVYDSVYYAPEITAESVVCDGEDGTLYDLSALEQKDKYELFLGGNYGKAVITTGVENGRHLLLVKRLLRQLLCAVPHGGLRDHHHDRPALLPRQHARPGGRGHGHPGADGDDQLRRLRRLFQADPVRAAGRAAPSAPTHVLMCRVSVPCLSLWERWPSAARTERQTMTIPALSVTCGDSSPKGRAKGLCPVIWAHTAAA